MSGLPIVLATAILSGTIISSCERNWASLAQRNIFQPFGITKHMSQAELGWRDGEKTSFGKTEKKIIGPQQRQPSIPSFICRHLLIPGLFQELVPMQSGGIF